MKLHTKLMAGLILSVMLMITGLTAADKEDKGPAVVIMGFKPTYGPIVITPNGSSRPVTGMEVSWYQSSPNAPTVTNGAPLAPTMSMLLEHGFEISFIAVEYQVLVRNK